MSEGHYNSVPSAEACQLDCQVGAAENLNHGVDADLDLGADHYNTVPFMVIKITHSSSEIPFNMISMSCH